jgi:hypothetical protein
MKSRGLIRESVPGYVKVNIQFDDPDKLELLALCLIAPEA